MYLHTLQSAKKYSPNGFVCEKMTKTPNFNDLKYMRMGPVMGFFSVVNFDIYNKCRVITIICFIMCIFTCAWLDAEPNKRMSSCEQRAEMNFNR